MSVETPRADGAYTGYAAPGERPPFGPYAGLAALFNAAIAAGLVAPSAADATCPSGSRRATSCSTASPPTSCRG